MFQNKAKFSPPNFTLYPLAWLAVSFAAGICLDSRLGFSRLTYIGVCLFSALLTLLFLRRNFVFIPLLLSFISIGALFYQIEKTSIAPHRLKNLYDSKALISGTPVKITGILQAKPELTVDGFFLLLKTESLIYKDNEQTVSGNIRLFAPVTDELNAKDYERLQLGYGTKIRAACELKREDRFSNPGVASQKEILDGQGIDAKCTLKSPLSVENLGPTQTFAPLAWAYERRQNLIVEFKNRFSVSTAGILIASLLGNRYHLDKTTSQSFREGGTFHILVISGLQITFIGGLTIFFLRLFTRNRFWQFLLASLFLWTYSLAVGADSPVTRAAVMFTVLTFADVIFRPTTLLNLLGASALILLIWRPSDLFDQSFQLTFMCVLSIVAKAFPLLERLKAIGEWRPTAETPAPPNCSKWLKTLSEMLYWSEKSWKKETARSVWQCRLFKTPAAEMLEKRKLQAVLRYVFETILVSIIVQLWLLPFSVVYFHRISIASVFLNVWVGLLMAIESVTAIIAVITAQISEVLAAPFVWATEILNGFILKVTLLFTESNWSSIRLPHYSGEMKAVYFLYFLPLIALTLALHRWKVFEFVQNKELKTQKSILKFSGGVFLVLFGIIIFHPFSAPTSDGRLHIDFLDVGQGDSALITMPTGETLLIDGGGRPNFNKLYVRRDGEESEPFEPDVQNIGETVVSKFLWEKGYDRVNYLLATHADTDHMQGLTDVAGNFRITSALVARTPLKDEDFADFYDVLVKKGIPLIKVAQGEVLNFGDVKIEILYPPPNDSADAVSDNNSSIVLRISYGTVRILMTGDVEKSGERELLQTPGLLRADVVKVAHHGSKTSSSEDFVNAAKPKLAVISVGTDSPYGHPKPEIVARWKNSEAKVMTTGENGTVSISTDGKELWLNTFLRNRTFR